MADEIAPESPLPASRLTTRLARLTSLLRSDNGKGRRLLWGGLIALLLLGMAGFFALPLVLESLLPKVLSDALHRPVQIRAIHFNPYTLTLQVEGFSVRHQDGKDEFVGFDRLTVNVSGSSLMHGGIVMDAIELDHPRVQVTRLPDGQYNIADLLAEWLKPSTEDKPLPRFSLNNIRIDRGQLLLQDQQKQQTHTVSDLAIHLPFLSSLPYHTEISVEPLFAARINGAPLRFSGQSRPFAKKHDSELGIDLSALDLTPYQDYAPFPLPFRLQSARLDSTLKLHFQQASGQPASIRLAGQVRLGDFALVDAASRQPLLSFSALSADIRQLDPLNREFALTRVHWQAPELHVDVNARGELNWLRLVERLQAASKQAAATTAKPETVTPAATPAEKPAARAPVWSLDEFRLEGGQLHWQDASSSRPVKATLDQLELGIGPLESQLAQPAAFTAALRLDAGKSLGLAQLALQGGQIDWARREVRLEGVALQGLRVAASRAANGQIEWLTPPRLRTTKPAAASATTKTAGKPAAGKSTETPAWLVKVGKFSSEAMQARFEDLTQSPVAVQTLDKVNLTLENLSTAKATPARLALQGKINQSGEIRSEGKVQWSPLLLNLGLETRSLPLSPLQPYINPHLNIAVTRGQFSSKGEIRLNEGKGGLDGRYRGSLTLGNFASVDKENRADFLKWKSLHLGNVDLHLQPFALDIGEIALSDFYSLLIVDPKGKLNVTQLVRKPDAPATPVGEIPTAATPAMSANASKAEAAPASIPAPTPAPQAPSPPIRISKVTLQGGTVNFTDRFVRPNYSAHLTRLGGRISNLSSQAGTMADLDIRASYDTAPVSITARLNPLAANPFLDLKADMKGVEMTGFSPYSGKYAGYKIEKGKLSMFVQYKLENGQLSADNRLFIDQFTFGEKVESPDATTLPVGLAIALLKNRQGEIDINLPISGSLQDPQFSFGGLIVKVIINLFVKAVTSPFALLGSMFGGGDDLSQVEFAPGYARLTPAAEKRLEGIARALLDRPALKLEITGRVEPEKDNEGLKRASMERAVRRQKQAEQQKKGTENDEEEISPADYPRYLQRAYREAKFPKPRNLIGMQKDLPVEEMEKLMQAHAAVATDDLAQLAQRRAQAVQSWLVEKGQVPGERIFLVLPKNGDKTGTRVDFSLR